MALILNKILEIKKFHYFGTRYNLLKKKKYNALFLSYNIEEKEEEEAKLHQ